MRVTDSQRLCAKVLGSIAVLMFSAGDADSADAPLDCDGPQQEMNTCAFNIWETEDRALNRWYERVLSKASDEEARWKLRTAQRAWIAFRDAECDRVADMARGGSISPMLNAGCRTRLTLQRIVELRAAAEAEPFMLGSGVPTWPATLVRLLQLSPDDLRGVYWLPKSVTQGDFDGDGVENDLGALGLMPAAIPEGEARALLLVWIVGDAEPLHVEIPVDGNSLCQAPIDLRVEYPDFDAKPATPILAVYDGACDAFRFRVTGEPSVLTMEPRN